MGLNSFQLKCIAIFTMLVDHTGAVLFPGETLFRIIGRISFPIFCFLLTEGFFHTRDIYRYMFRLGIFALISEIPYDLALQGEILETEHQNVFFTLLIGVFLMYALEQTREWLIRVIDIILAMSFAVFLKTDYSFKGILLIAVYALLRNRPAIRAGAGTAWNFLWNGSVQKYGALASIPIAMYNGEKGFGTKYFFYLFYPIHLLILYMIKISL